MHPGEKTAMENKSEDDKIRAFDKKVIELLTSILVSMATTLIVMKLYGAL